MHEVTFTESAVPGVRIATAMPRIPVVGEYVVFAEIEYVIGEVYFVFGEQNQYLYAWASMTKSEREQ